MRRAPALVPLSHDHHQALEAALVLKRAAPGGEAAAAERFLRFWARHGQDHFAVEEEVLLPALEAADAATETDCDRVRAEHRAIRRAADAVEDASLEDLRALGTLLEAHVRFEERELFPLAERLLGDDGLAALPLRQ